MATKAGINKLTKLKSVLKKWNSFSLSSRSNSISSASSDDDCCGGGGAGSVPVFVGKSRRRYLVSSAVAEHPLFRELVDRSSSSGGQVGDEGINVACEVVLFEHLLWMLENADDDPRHPESMNELVDFYHAH